MSQAPPGDRPDLPQLRSGIQLLTGEDRLTGPLQTLVLDHLLRTGGHAVWLDAAGHAVTHQLARLAPSDRLLDRVQVARGFTHTQHNALVNRLDAVVDDTTTLVVCPALDAPYRTDCPASQAASLFRRSLAGVATVAREHDLPVLATRRRADETSAPLATAADRTIRVERTSEGPRFVGDDFETLVYPADADGYAQTTLRYWARLLTARHPAVANADACTDADTPAVAISEGA
jgi:hypothetical protein